MFFFSVHSRRLWEVSGFDFCVGGGRPTLFGSWLESWFKNVSETKFLGFVCTLWEIWCACNKACFHDEIPMLGFCCANIADNLIYVVEG